MEPRTFYGIAHEVHSQFKIVSELIEGEEGYEKMVKIVDDLCSPGRALFVVKVDVLCKYER